MQVLDPLQGQLIFLHEFEQFGVSDNVFQPIANDDLRTAKAFHLQSFVSKLPDGAFDSIGLVDGLGHLATGPLILADSRQNEGVWELDSLDPKEGGDRR